MADEKELILENPIVPQPGGQLPWGHIELLINKVKDEGGCLFNIQKNDFE